jgi:hypothetical protein
MKKRFIFAVALASGTVLTAILCSNVFPDQTWALLTSVRTMSRCGWWTNKGFSDSIAAQVDSGANKVDIGQLASFGWDELFIFGPYDYPARMCRTLKLSAEECSSSHFNDLDGETLLLVFMQDRKIARRVCLSRSICDFDVVCIRRPIARADAIFTKSSGTWYLSGNPR